MARDQEEERSMADLRRLVEEQRERNRSSGRSKFTRSTEEELKRSNRIEFIQVKIKREEILPDTSDPCAQKRINTFDHNLAMIQ